MSNSKELYIPNVTESSWLAVIHPLASSPDGVPVRRKAKAVLHLGDSGLEYHTKPAEGYEDALAKAAIMDDLFRAETEKLARPVGDGIRPFGVVTNGLTRIIFRREYVMSEKAMNSAFEPDGKLIDGLGQTALWTTENQPARTADNLPHLLTAMEGIHFIETNGTSILRSHALTVLIENSLERDAIPSEDGTTNLDEFDRLTDMNSYLIRTPERDQELHENLDEAKQALSQTIKQKAA